MASCCDDPTPCDALELTSATLDDLQAVRGVNEHGCEKYEEPKHLLCRALGSLEEEGTGVFGTSYYVTPDCAKQKLPTPAPETPISPVDTSTVDMSAAGTANHTISATVKVSGEAGNQVQIRTDGLYVPQAAAETHISVVDTSTVDLTASGTANHTVTAAVKVSGDAGNQLQVHSDGLYVPLDVDTPETPITPVDTVTIDMVASGTANHVISANVKVSSTAGNQVQLKTDGIYVPAPPAVDTCASLTDLPISGALLAGDYVVVPGNPCSLKQVQAAAGDNWGSQVVQHDGTLSGSGTAGDPLKAVPCAVVQGVTDSATQVQAGDKIIVKTPSGCEARPMPAAAGVTTDCTLASNAGSLGVAASVVIAGSTLDISSSASPLRTWQLVSGSRSPGDPISTVAAAVISNPSTCRAAKVKVDVDFGYWGMQIQSIQDTSIAAGFEVNVGTGWKRVSTHEGDEGKDVPGGGNLSDMGQDGTSASFVLSIPAGTSITIQARVVSATPSTVSVYYSEVPIISWFGLAI